MKICIYHQFDPEVSAGGGIGRFILNFVGSSPQDFNFFIVCGSSCRELFVEHLITVAGVPVTIFPIFRLTDENNRKLLPITVSYCVGLLKAKQLLPKGDVHFTQRIDYIPFLPAWVGKSKLVTLFHTDIERNLDKSVSESYWKLIPNVYNRLLKFTLKKVDLVMSVSAATKKYIEKIIPTKSVVCVNTWPDRKLFKIVEDTIAESYLNRHANITNFIKGRKVVIFVGRLQSVKNPVLAIDVIKCLPNSYCLLIVGDGNMREELDKYVLEIGLEERVLFTGNLPQKDLVYLYNISNTYLSTSHFEGMSVALLEALSCGLYVVTTNTGQAEAILTSRTYGVVVDKFEDTELAKCIQEKDIYSGTKICISRAIISYSPEPIFAIFRGIL